MPISTDDVSFEVVLVDSILECENPTQLAKTAFYYRPDLGKTAPAEVWKWFRRRCEQYSKFKCEGIERESRAGKPWTWAERWVFKWGTKRSAETPDHAVLSYDHIALILSRPVSEVEAYATRKKGLNTWQLDIESKKMQS
jgi:hypothetical protein